MKLLESEITSIVYTNESGDKVSARTIIPTSVPFDSVRAIDVSELTEAEQQATAALVADYKQYVHDFYQGLYKFEDWVEHTTGATISPKWRSFKVAGIKQP